MNLMLMAVGLGLATCWIGAFDEEAVRKVLDIPNGLRPVVIVPLGYSNLAEPPKAPARRPLNEVVKIVE